MCRIQIWLTATRAVSGFRGSVIQWASAERRPVLVALSQPPGLLDLASSYALAVAPSAPAFILFVLLRQAMQARGLFRPVMWIVLAANLLNVVGNLVLIHGLGPVPPLGVVGAGLSTALSRFAMLAGGFAPGSTGAGAGAGGAAGAGVGSITCRRICGCRSAR
jgi:Na+-driven multidrug efflux pump